MQTVIGNNQVRVKDCYASAPNIDLTLRSNGEERVMVMDSLGQFVVAGLEAPTVAPTASVVVVAAPGFAQPTWLCYRYVYAATKRYPLVENAVTAGGNLSPRSNPSPSVTVNINVANRAVDLTVTKSQRGDIDAIWIYRTDFYGTIEEAEQASAEGSLFYAGTIFNDGTAGTIIFQDRALTVLGNEQIEFDNFMAEQFWLCAYVPPYFYGYANLPFTAPIEVTSLGVVTLTNPWSTTNRTGDKWFDGRNRQIVTMDGIASGGFDGYGSFYFKWIDNTTAQLCLDLQLLQNAPVGYNGTTNITIKGPPANLYRSKANNPFSWGMVTVVGDLNVPAPYVHKVGGGQGTAMIVVPVLNLLKLDTEGPNKTYVFNLKAQGTEEFETSKQEISSDYSASNHWSQFPAKTAKGDSLIWFIDNKFSVVCQSDGANNQDVSSPVYESIRDMSRNASDRLFSHGVYDPNTQLSLMWVTVQGPVGEWPIGIGPETIQNRTINNTTIAYHHPTDTWSILDYKGVLCSTPYLDRDTNQEMVLIGTEGGRIGRLFDNTKEMTPSGFEVYRYANWIHHSEQWPVRGQCPNLGATPDVLTIQMSVANLELSGPVIGLWMWFIYDYEGTEQPEIDKDLSIVGCARILSYVAGGAPDTTEVTFDRFRRWPDGAEVDGNVGIQNFDFTATGSNASYYLCFLESQLCNCCKVLDLDQPTEQKSIAEVWVTRIDLNNLGDPAFPVYKWTNSFRMSITNNYPSRESQAYTFGLERELIHKNNWYKVTPIPLDSTKIFGVSLWDVGYGPAIFSYLQVTIR